MHYNRKPSQKMLITEWNHYCFTPHYSCIILCMKVENRWKHLTLECSVKSIFDYPHKRKREYNNVMHNLMKQYKDDGFVQYEWIPFNLSSHIKTTKSISHKRIDVWGENLIHILNHTCRYHSLVNCINRVINWQDMIKN